MIRWQWLSRATVFSAAILLIACLSSTIWAQAELEYPRPCPGRCVPNVRNFGYNKPNWRLWPGEPTLDEVNPRAVTSDVLPTPEGRTERSLPRATPLQPYQQPTPQPPQPRPQAEPSQQQAEPSQQQLPPEGPLTVPTPTPEKGLLPEGTTIRPPEGTMTPPTAPEGQETKPKPSKPLIEDGEFPGLPDEHGPSKPPSPSKPLSPSKGKSSDLMPVPQDVPKQAAATNPLFTRGAGDAAVVSLAGNRESERNSLPPGVYRADSIGVVPSSSAGGIQRTGYATAELAARQGGADQKITPTVALNGYCPVELSHSGRWVLGDLRWTVVHRGWIYRLSGAEQRQQFLADPDRFTPVNFGNDVVLSVDQNRVVPGQTAHCAIYNDRLYMFSSVDTQIEFNKRPERYAAGR